MLVAAIVAGAAAGAAYALLPGYLRARFEVHEIFSGVAFNFLAGAFAVYLIIGPWARAGDRLDERHRPHRRAGLAADARRPAHLPVVAIVLAVAAVVAVAVVMRGTRYGLRLKAVGRSPASARLMGVSPRRYTLSAFSSAARSPASPAPCR